MDLQREVRLTIRHLLKQPGYTSACVVTLALAIGANVVGVMPKDFDYPRGTDVWMPVVPILTGAGGERLDALREVGVLFLVGRLRRGVTPAMAKEDLDQLTGQVARAGVSQRLGTSVVVMPFLDYLLGPVRQALWALFAAVAVLLLIGCANVSGLMLTRVWLRRREHAVQLALGATPLKLGRQWILETVILSLAGGCLGLIGSQSIAKAIVVLAPQDIPRLADVAINLPVAAFTFVTVLTTAVLCGVGPVRYAGAANLLEGLNEARRATPSRQSHRARSLLLVFQMVLTVVLLVAAGLVVRSFTNLRRIDLGFVPSNVVTMNVSPRNARPSTNEWMAEFLRRVTELPGVDAAGAVYLRPLALGPIGQETAVILEGQPESPEAARQNPALNYQVATPGYFSAMRIQLKDGRLFNDQDTARSPRVALVGESAARRLWPGEDPIGKRVLMPTQSPDGRQTAWRTVVGVVNDVRYRGLDDVRLDVYDAATQSELSANDLVVRTTGELVKFAAAVQAEARRLDPDVLINGVTTMQAIVARAAAPWRFSVWMFTLFAILAFALATVGLVSLVSLDVTQRRHEFAIRLALGAQRQAVLRSVLLLAGRRVVPGIGLGVLAALAGTRALRGILFGVEPLDVATYMAVVAIVFGVVTAASYLPARRAARLDPLPLLRQD